MPQTLNVKKFLTSLGAVIDEYNMELVEAVIDRVLNHNNAEWQQAIDEEIDDVLYTHNVKCTRCGQRVTIRKQSGVIYVDNSNEKQ